MTAIKNYDNKTALTWILFKRSDSCTNLLFPRDHQWSNKHLFIQGVPGGMCQTSGKVFLMLKYTDITQNTYVQSWTVTEIMATEKCGLLADPRTVPVSWQPYPCPSLSVVSYYGNPAHARNKLFMYFLLGDKAVQVSAWHSCHV